MRKSLMAVVLVFLSTALYAARQSPDGPLPAADDYTVLTGRVVIGTVDAHTIGVIVDDGSPYRHVFRLWTETSVNTFRATSQSASIEFRGDELVVMAADQAWFYALVTTAAGSRTPRQPIGFTGARYVGYGLNHEIRPVGSKVANGNGRHAIAALDDCSLCLDNADYDVFGGGGGTGGGGSCDSGGIGSTSCSTSNSYGSCSVTCTGSYYYACCTAATSSNSVANCRCKS